MNKEKLLALDYYLLPGKINTNNQYYQVQNRAYTFWKQFWTNVFKDLGLDKVPSADEFVRQDRIGTLTYRGSVVAVHLYTFFDLGSLSSREHSYFTRYYPESFMKELDQHNAQRVLSLEYLSVAPEWRTSLTKVSLAAVLVGLGLKVTADNGLDAAIAPARKDNSVSKVCQDQGAKIVHGDVMVFNAPCDLIAFFNNNMRPASDPFVNELVQHFWSKRIDATSDHAQQIKIAA